MGNIVTHVPGTWPSFPAGEKPQLRAVELPRVSAPRDWFWACLAREGTSQDLVLTVR